MTTDDPRRTAAVNARRLRAVPLLVDMLRRDPGLVVRDPAAINARYRAALAMRAALDDLRSLTVAVEVSEAKAAHRANKAEARAARARDKAA